MKFRKEQQVAPVDPIRAKAAERLSRLGNPDILNWADQAGTGIAKALDDYRRLGDFGSLQEAEDALSALAGVVDVLKRRHALGVGTAPVAAVH